MKIKELITLKLNASQLMFKKWDEEWRKIDHTELTRKKSLNNKVDEKMGNANLFIKKTLEQGFSIPNSCFVAAKFKFGSISIWASTF